MRRPLNGRPNPTGPISFIADFQKIRGPALPIGRSCHVQILLGSGTLANDAVAAQLTLEKKPGLILSNGEFGERLVDHAKRFGLTFDTLKFPLGRGVRPRRGRAISLAFPGGGMALVRPLRNFDRHVESAARPASPVRRRGVKMCADCISSIGLVPVNLERIYLASGASGKGLAGYPGLCMVYYNHSIASITALPRYLDLGWYDEHQGIAFTHSSNLVQALDTAVRQHDWERKLVEVAEVSARLRAPIARTWVQPDRHRHRSHARGGDNRIAAGTKLGRISARNCRRRDSCSVTTAIICAGATGSKSASWATIPRIKSRRY